MWDRDSDRAELQDQEWPECSLCFQKNNKEKKCWTESPILFINNQHLFWKYNNSEADNVY